MKRVSQEKEIRDEHKRKNAHQVNKGRTFNPGERKETQCRNIKKEKDERKRREEENQDTMREIKEREGKKDESKMEKKVDNTRSNNKDLIVRRVIKKKTLEEKNENNGLKTLRRNETQNKESRVREDIATQRQGSIEKRAETAEGESGKGKTNERKAKLLKKKNEGKNPFEKEGKENINEERETRVQRVFSGFGNNKINN